LADETTTEEQLIAEQSTSGSGEPAPAAGVAPGLLAPSTRRGVLSWIAPMVMFVGTTLKPSTAQAADDFVGADEPGRCTPRP
jgi:hypothetical protein